MEKPAHSVDEIRCVCKHFVRWLVRRCETRYRASAGKHVPEGEPFVVCGLAHMWLGISLSAVPVIAAH